MDNNIAEVYLHDEEFPIINKPLAVNDFVVNKMKFEDILPMSVGLIKGISAISVNVLFIGKNCLKCMPIDSVVVIDIHQTGKEKGTDKPAYKYKICNVCHIIKVNTQFQNNQNDASGRHTTRPSCIDCRKVIDGCGMTSRQKAAMEAIKPKDYELFECPICHKITIPGVTANIVIDHDHNTGVPRCWICDSCNTGLGRFKDSKELLNMAIDYLRRYNNNKTSEQELFI